jgi:hypothetical protein
MKRIDDLPFERSDDRARATMPHVRAAIAQLASLRNGTFRCARCRTRAATHVIDSTQTPQAVCEGCAGEWRTLSPRQRDEARLEFERRGIQ